MIQNFAGLVLTEAEKDKSPYGFGAIAVTLFVLVVMYLASKSGSDD